MDIGTQQRIIQVEPEPLTAPQPDRDEPFGDPVREPVEAPRRELEQAAR